jgi:hypothetical protein
MLFTISNKSRGAPRWSNLYTIRLVLGKTPGTVPFDKRLLLLRLLKK